MPKALRNCRPREFCFPPTQLSSKLTGHEIIEVVFLKASSKPTFHVENVDSHETYRRLASLVAASLDNYQTADARVPKDPN